LDLQQTKGKVEVGSVAPDFILRSQTREMVSLRDFIGSKPVVLFFYPKDDTPGCTRQVCTFRDEYEGFRKLDAEVIGVSSDSVESHRSIANWYEPHFPDSVHSQLLTFET
jgi:peroxiredoxin Q/BCP